MNPARMRTTSQVSGENFMDHALKDRLDKWHFQIEILKEAEKECLQIEAQEKPKFATLFLGSDGKTVADRESGAYASTEWKMFQQKLVEVRCRLNHEKRELELKQKAFDAEYLSFKIDADAIRKFPRAIT